MRLTERYAEELLQTIARLSARHVLSAEPEPWTPLRLGSHLVLSAGLTPARRP